jgi:phenylacetate-coenzyme A ligase PaaK-like adenylate-forming protein
LPISFFKTHDVKTGLFEAEKVFESSGTTGTVSSKHHVKDLEIYRQSFTRAFTLFYGSPSDYCIMGLLPSYMERGNSSLVLMVDELINLSTHPLSGIYLNNPEQLYQAIVHNEIRQQPTIVFGVTYALLDLADKWNVDLKHTTIIETGGMKGRRTELTRQEVHKQLQKSFGQKDINSEYSMTELMSQAYSKKDGIFSCPSWMKVFLREEDDPRNLMSVPTRDAKPITGLINIIDLANVHSCAFIATEDIGRLYHNGSFEVLGRSDNSDIRGCSLLTA